MSVCTYIPIRTQIVFTYYNFTVDEIEIESDTGRIIVSPIDRDYHQLQTYEFTIIACEVPEPESCVNQNAIFIVDDIDDQRPEISVDPNDLVIKIPENSMGTINIPISAHDIDFVSITSLREIFQSYPQSRH